MNDCINKQKTQYHILLTSRHISPVSSNQTLPSDALMNEIVEYWSPTFITNKIPTFPTISI